MKNDFKYKNWDLQNYIELERKAKKLTENDLENVSGGIMNKKLAASILMGLSVLTASNNIAKANENTSLVAATSQSEVKNQNVNFEITKEQAIEDINYVLKVIKDRHASSVEKLPDEIVNQAKIEIENLKDKVNVIDELRIVCRIFAKLCDEHSMVYLPRCIIGRLPFDTEMRGNKLVCANGDFKDYEIVSVNDISVQDLYQNFKNNFGYEIEEFVRFMFLENPTGLSGGTLAVAGIDVLKPLKITFRKGEITQSSDFNLGHFSSEHSDYSWIKYEIDEQQSTGIFTLNECTFNDEYINTVNKFFTEVKNKNLKNIVIDLRNNNGGDSKVINEFAAYIKNLPTTIKGFRSHIRANNKLIYEDGIYKLTDEDIKLRNTLPLYDGNIYILTSHATFSSGMWFATIFSDNNLAKIVGEVPGNSPTGFGDITEIYTTPNAKLMFNTSFKKFYRPDETKDGKKLIPDVQVPVKDALNKVYEIIDEEKNYGHFETEHFDVIYPKDSKEQCEKALKELEESYNKVTGDLKVKIDKKTKIKLFKTKDDFHKSIGCYGTDYANWVNGTGNDGFIKTHLELTPERMKEILVHEFTHIAVENINRGHIPFIFNDGIATYEANQTWLKGNLPNLTDIPETPDWLIKHPQNQVGYALAYSFTEFIVKNYGYDKMIEFLKVDYQHNKFNFESIKDIYSKWRSEPVEKSL